MPAQDCPACGLINPPSAQRCDCGYDFVAGEVSREALAAHAERKRTGTATIVIGGVILVGGLGLSLALTAADDGGFTVFHGAIIVGLLTIVRGFMRRVRG